MKALHRVPKKGLKTTAMLGKQVPDFSLQGTAGTSFSLSSAVIPKPAPTGQFEANPPSRGQGDTVTALANWKGTGRTAFLVFNGRLDEPDSAGPVQLIEFYDTP